MEGENPCCCCMIKPPHKGLKTPYIYFGTTEVILDLIEECFQMQLTLDNEDGSGICEECEARLRDSCEFKRQVQRCQAKLQARRARRDTVVLVKDEVPLLEAADEIGTCDDSESDVKPPVLEGPVDVTAQEPNQKPQDSSRASAVTSPEEGLISLSWRGASGAVALSTRPISARAQRQLATTCSVRLERLRGEVMHTCTKCSLSFAQASALATHVQHVHSDTYKAAIAAKRGVWICDTCGNQYKQKYTLIRHFKSHERNYIYTANLNKFLVIHPGERPYGCKVCGKRFESKFCMTRHTVVHTKVKAFSCEICSKPFKYKHELTRHVMLHSGQKPYSCNLCDKTFTQRSGLNQHMPIHTGIKAFTCPVCEKSFAHRHTLYNHVRIHTGLKPYTCEVCNKSFTERGHLRRHTRVHTGQRPYTCDMCDRRFAQKIHVEFHKARVHT